MDDGSGASNAAGGGVAEPARLGDERTTLLGFLQRQRDLVAWKVRGASDDDLRTAATPTGLGPHGVVRHLENVERAWIRDRFAGQDGLSFDWSDEDPDGEFSVPEDVPMEWLLAAYAAESARCDEVVAAHDLSDTSARDGYSLRWILLHLVEETARHLGHLDLLRERADGGVGEEPDEGS